MVKLETLPAPFGTPKHDRKRKSRTPDEEETTPSPKCFLLNDKKIMIRLSPKKVTSSPTESTAVDTPAGHNETRPTLTSHKNAEGKVVIKVNRSPKTMAPTPPTTPQKLKLVIKLSPRKPAAKAQEAEKEKAGQVEESMDWVPLGPITPSSRKTNEETATKETTMAIPKPAETLITDSLYLDTLTTMKKLARRHSSLRLSREYCVNDENTEMATDITDAMVKRAENGEMEMDRDLKACTTAAEEQKRAFEATIEMMEKETIRTRTSFDIDVAYPNTAGNYKVRTYHERYSDNRFSETIRSDATTEALLKERVQEKMVSDRLKSAATSKLISDTDRYSRPKGPIQLRRIPDERWWEHTSLRINKVHAFKKARRAEIEAEELYRALTTPRKHSRGGNVSPEHLVLIRRGRSPKFVFEDRDAGEMPRRDSQRGVLRDESIKYHTGKVCAEQAAQYWQAKTRIADVIRRHRDDTTTGFPGGRSKTLSAVPMHIRRLATMRGAPCSHDGDGHGTVLPSRGSLPLRGSRITENGREIGYLPAGWRGEQRRSTSLMKGRRMWRC